MVKGTLVNSASFLNSWTTLVAQLGLLVHVVSHANTCNSPKLLGISPEYLLKLKLSDDKTLIV